jgi:predicted metal-dependent hydrolase
VEKEKRIILIDGEQHHVNIHTERRNSVRASITPKSGINIRLPRRLGKHQREIEINNMVKWASERIRAKPGLTRKRKTYSHGNFLKTNSKEYVLDIMMRDSIKNFAKISGDKIIFKISDNHPPHKAQEYISKQLQKLLAKHHLAELESHVHRLNGAHFNKDIRKISYKCTHSRWGACRFKTKEITLSTKLLLAPLPVLEYVIIHELAHLIEANHSRRFWDLVRRADPTYKEKIRWLKAHGHTLEI